MLKKIVYLIIFISISISFCSCSNSDSVTCKNSTSITNFLVSSVVTRNIKNFKALKLFYDGESHPMILAYNEDTIEKFYYEEGNWKEIDILKGVSGYVGFGYSKDGVWILNYGENKLSLYLWDGSAIKIDNVYGELDLDGKISGASLLLNDSYVYVGFIEDDSGVFLAYRKVNEASWRKMVVNNSADEGSGFYTGIPVFLVENGNEFFVSYYDAGFGQPDLSYNMGNKWIFTTISDKEDNWLDYGWNRVLFIGEHGEVGMFFNERVKNNIYYAELVTETWTKELVDNSDNYLGDFMDGGKIEGIPFVFYYDGYHGSLKLAFKKNNQWKKKYIRTVGASGFYVSSALNRDRIGVVYADMLNNVLFYQEISEEDLR